MRPFAPFNARPLKSNTPPKRAISQTPDDEAGLSLALGLMSKAARRAVKPAARKRAPQLKILSEKAC